MARASPPARQVRSFLTPFSWLMVRILRPASWKAFRAMLQSYISLDDSLTCQDRRC